MKKTVLVTGAAGNLGKSVVDKFVSEGWNVVGTISASHPMSAPVSSESKSFIAADLADEDAASSLVQTVLDRHSKIDAAVLTVGGFATGSIAETSSDDVLAQYKLNFETAYNTARPIFLHMKQQGYGRIFLIGSKSGLSSKDGKGTVAYGLAKSLLFRLAELMNIEAKGSNVVTTVIVPSTIDTPANRKSMPDADVSTWVTPDAIAATIYFYCSAEADAIRAPVIKMYNKG
ncbi:MAG: SDR family NAD(P)-dependent oxidoreductase [Chitinophagaceae bacterium]|nr:SDR family NAD(P)-dependent oxidoreductase [Chitinophagaceae bacterium]